MYVFIHPLTKHDFLSHMNEFTDSHNNIIIEQCGHY